MRRKKRISKAQIIHGRQSFSVSMKSETVDQIDHLAAKLGISRSRFCEVSVESALAMDKVLITIITFALGTKALHKLRGKSDSTDLPDLAGGSPCLTT